MPTVKELQERRAPIGAEIRRMADTLTGDKKDFTAEERSKWDALNKDFNDQSAQIEIQRKAEEVDAELERSNPNPPGLEDSDRREKRRKDRTDPAAGPSEEVRALALQAWARFGKGLSLTDAHRAAAKRSGLSLRSNEIEVRLARRPQFGPPKEGRAQSVGTTTAGGYTVPEGFVYSLERAMKDFNGVRQVADVMRTEDGASLPWPTVNDTGNTGALIAENTQVAGQDVAFSVVTFGAYKFSSKEVLIPHELLDDSAFDMAAELSSLLGERLGRVGETYATTGSGSGEPQGVVTASTLGKTAAMSNAIAADEVIDLIHSIDPAYRQGASLMMHDGILAYLRKLKGTSNEYLFQMATDGSPDRIHGLPVVINQNMQATVATATKTILCGDFKKFKIRDVKAVRIVRLDERYADKDQVGFFAFTRWDSKLLNAGTNPIKHLLQA